MITVGALGSRTPEEILSTADLILYAGFIRACSAFLKAGRRRLWIMTCAVAGTLPFYLRGRDLYGFAEFGPSLSLAGPAILLLLALFLQDIVTSIGQTEP